MAFQYVPSRHERPHDRPRPAFLNSSLAGSQEDWIAQQSLFMGSSTPLFHRQVSMSPQESFQGHSRHINAPAFQGASFEPLSSPVSSRSMYPSPTYQYGNPGFYYDLMLYPNCVASQTHSQVPHATPYPTSIHPYSGIRPPTMPYHSDNFFEDNGELLTTQLHVDTSIPSPSDTPNVVLGQTTNNASPSSPILDMNFEDYSPSPFVQNLPTRDVGCQPMPTSPTSPVVIKEAKKLTIPQFDPAKISWSSFAMKLHASLIECDLGYLLRESLTNPTNATHSKELMLELFKKLQGSAINLFTGLSAQ
jgi:hypothetical protein